MWKSKKMLTLMTVIFILFSGLGNSDSGDRNGEEKELLCNVLTAGERILKTIEANDNHLRKILEEAIYGSSKENCQFGKDGGPIGGKCFYNNFRTQYCIIKSGTQKYSWGGGKEGCYAESLIGTAMCLCTPGGHGEEDDLRKLCGVKVAEYSDRWRSNWSPLDRRKYLFQEVWKKVLQNCTYGRKNEQDFSEELEVLKKLLVKIKGKVEKKSENRNLYFLGGKGQADCNAINGNDICAGYQRKSGENIDIPWADKIENVVNELQKMGKEKDRLSQASAAVISPRQQNNADEAAQVEGQDAAPVLANHISRKNSQQIREEETEKQAPKSTGKSEEAPKSRPKRTTTNHISVIEIPHLASDPNEDGSLLISLLSWLPLAVVFN